MCHEPKRGSYFFEKRKQNVQGWVGMTLISCWIVDVFTLKEHTMWGGVLGDYQGDLESHMKREKRGKLFISF